MQPPGAKASNWHGTSVVSLLAADAKSSTPGLIPNARFLVADAFFRTSDDNPRPRTDTAHLVDALQRLEKEGAQIINMSLVGPRDELVHERIIEMSRRGIVFIAAAGNGGPSAPPGYPAAYSDEVIAVTAVNDRRQSYDYANRGSYIEVAAPGVRIWAALPDNMEGMVSGTSFAAPFVTAIAAVTYKRLNAERLRLNPKRVMLAAFLIDNIGKGERNDRYGLGLVKAPPSSNCTPGKQPVAQQ
jgi:subtilisin family serine protease